MTLKAFDKFVSCNWPKWHQIQTLTKIERCTELTLQLTFRSNLPSTNKNSFWAFFSNEQHMKSCTSIWFWVKKKIIYNNPHCFARSASYEKHVTDPQRSSCSSITWPDPAASGVSRGGGNKTLVYPKDNWTWPYKHSGSDTSTCPWQIPPSI